MVDNVSNYMMVYLLYYKAMNFLRCDFTAICRNLDGRAIEKKKVRPHKTMTSPPIGIERPGRSLTKWCRFFFLLFFFLDLNCIYSPVYLTHVRPTRDRNP